jgi:CheY-like chemotaxis protein
VKSSHLPTILYADDDSDDFLFLQESADQKGSGVDFQHVYDGEQAISFLELAKTEDTLPQLILLDLNMPKRDGRTTLEYIKSDKELCRIPVVMFSNSENSRDKEFCKNRGALTYINKPSHFQGYHDVVVTLLSYINKSEPI